MHDRAPVAPGRGRHSTTLDSGLTNKTQSTSNRAKSKREEGRINRGLLVWESDERLKLYGGTSADPDHSIRSAGTLEALKHNPQFEFRIEPMTLQQWIVRAMKEYAIYLG